MSNKILYSTLFLLVSNLVYAENNTTTETSNEKAGEWWKYSSYDYTYTDNVLFHIEGTISYNQSSGNEEAETLKTSISTIIRKGHFGASLLLSQDNNKQVSYADKQDTSPTEIDNTDYSIAALIGYDINDKFYMHLGYEKSKNTAFEIHNQVTLYLGLGYRLLKTDNHNLNIFVAKGREDISFMTYPLLPSGETDGIFYQTSYHWMITPSTTLTANYSFLKPDMADRDTSSFSTKMTVMLSDNIAMVVGYSREYLEAQDTIDRFNTDESFFTALKFQY